jgi:hypothetical protein
VDEDDLTRKIDALKIADLIDSFRERGRPGVVPAGADALPTADGDYESEMRRSWRTTVDKLTRLKLDGSSSLSSVSEGVHAELLIFSAETDETRAGALLDLGEKALLHVLGGVSVARVDVNVVTAQKKTSAKLNLFERGVRLAAIAYGVGGTPLREVEDFLCTRAAAEFEMLLLRFYDSDVVVRPKLSMHLEFSNRTLEVQRNSAAAATYATE